MARRQADRLPEGDDGRTIADMNVEGMPWYRPPGPEAKPAPEGSQSREKAPRDLLVAINVDPFGMM